MKFDSDIFADSTVLDGNENTKRNAVISNETKILFMINYVLRK